MTQIGGHFWLWKSFATTFSVRILENNHFPRSIPELVLLGKLWPEFWQNFASENDKFLCTRARVKFFEEFAEQFSRNREKVSIRIKKWFYTAFERIISHLNVNRTALKSDSITRFRRSILFTFIIHNGLYYELCHGIWKDNGDLNRYPFSLYRSSIRKYFSPTKTSSQKPAENYARITAVL